MRPGSTFFAGALAGAPPLLPALMALLLRDFDDTVSTVVQPYLHPGPGTPEVPARAGY